MKFRKKPVVIDAIQLTKDNAEEVAAWCGGVVDDYWDTPNVKIPTLEGTMNAAPLDWIIQGVNGEFYPCKPEIFEKTYEAEDSAQASGEGAGR